MPPPEVREDASVLTGQEGGTTVKPLRPAKKPRIGKAQGQDEKRRTLLAAWERVVRADLRATNVGRQMEAAGSLEEEKEILRLTLYQKSVSTLATRLTPMTAYMRYMRTPGLGLVWPPTEGSAYAFLKVHAGPTMPASRANQFLEAIRFCHFTMGLKVDEVMTSKRLEGYAEEQRRRLGGRQQAPALSLLAVRALEQALELDELQDSEVLVAGAALILLSLRSRFNDFNPNDFQTNEAEIVVQVDKTKTAQSKTRLGLTMIGPSSLTLGAEWLDKYLDRRTQMGIPMPTFPLFPAGSGEGWCEVPGRLQDFNNNLRALLGDLGIADHYKYSSHSLKATLLSWACAYGMKRDTRAALGYHVGEKKMTSVQAYSRDRLEAPLVELSEMLDDIRQGKFTPGARKPKDCPKAQDNTPLADDQEDIDAGIPGDPESASEEEDREPEEKDIFWAIGKEDEAADDAKSIWAQNKDSKKIHVVRSWDKDRFVCGRTFGVNFVLLTDVEPEEMAIEVRCEGCFKGN